MKNWLITARSETLVEDLGRLLAEVGCRGAESLESTPLDKGEQALAIAGPDDLPERLRGVREILGVFPNSDLELGDLPAEGGPEVTKGE